MIKHPLLRDIVACFCIICSVMIMLLSIYTLHGLFQAFVIAYGFIALVISAIGLSGG
jgi:hypothetical protein